jgi:hypothetical protein
MANSPNGPVTNSYEGKPLYQLRVLKSPGVEPPAGNLTRHFTLAHVEFMEEFRDLMIVDDVAKMEEKGMAVWWGDWILDEVLQGGTTNGTSTGMGVAGSGKGPRRGSAPSSATRGGASDSKMGSGMEYMEHAPGDAAMEMEGVQSEMGHMPHDMSMPGMVMPPMRRRSVRRGLRRRNDIETDKKKMEVATKGQWVFRYEKDGVYRTNG